MYGKHAGGGQPNRWLALVQSVYVIRVFRRNRVPEVIHHYLRRKQTLDAALKTFDWSCVGQQRVLDAF